MRRKREKVLSKLFHDKERKYTFCYLNVLTRHGTTANPHSPGRLNRSFLLHHNARGWNLRSRHSYYWLSSVHLGALWSLFQGTGKELNILEKWLGWQGKWSEHWKIKERWQTVKARSLIQGSQNVPERKLDPVGPRQKVTDWIGQKYTTHREKKLSLY